MPRYENSGPAVLTWYNDGKSGSGSSTFDLCRKCGKKHDGKPLPANMDPYHIGEPKGILSESDSPLVDEYDFDGYVCDTCGVAISPKNY